MEDLFNKEWNFMENDVLLGYCEHCHEPIEGDYGLCDTCHSSLINV